jgi:outer membrane immunogenic protein
VTAFPDESSKFRVEIGWTERSRLNSKTLRDQRKRTSGEIAMKKILLGVVGLAAVGMTAPATAADLAARPYTKAPPPMIAAVYDWSGFYIGANGGWGQERRCFDAVAAVGGTVLGSAGCHDANGGVAGGQIGYRWQSGGWVFGLEAQGDWANLRGDNVNLLFPAFVNRTKMDAFGLFTGQIGYAWNNALFYFKGGAAVVDDRNDILTNGVVVASTNSDTRWGGTVGVGFEYGFAPNWSLGIEYDHLFLDNRTATFATPGGLIFATDRIRGDADLVMGRINYRFGWGGQVIPKY